METTTNETLKKLKSQIIRKFGPTIQILLDEGADAGRITDIIQKQVEVKTKNYYNQPQRPNYHGIVAQITGQGGGSKAEMVFYEMLIENNIPFQFQYPIGPYIADYLINESFVIELDGPVHNKPEQKDHDKKKDKYLNRMGYQVLRLPLVLITLDQDAVLEGIKELLQ